MIKNILQEGFALKRKGHYKHAIEVFYKALEEDNSSSELLLEIANLYYLLGNEERTLNYIEQILTNEPDHISALKLLKQIFLDKKAYAEAEQTAKNIYCISHENDDLIEIFKLLNIQGKFDEIFEYNINTPNIKIYLEQATALYRKQDYAKAEQLLQKVLELDSENQEALLLLGKVLYANNKKECCAELLNKLHVDNKNAELQNFTGLVNAYQENYKSAITCFYAALKLERTNPDYYANLANVYFKQGDYINAKRYYNMAISLAPENSGYHFALANLYYSEGHYKKALEELDENLIESRVLKVIILYNTGYLALAKKELDMLIGEKIDNELVKEYNTLINKELGLN